MAGGPAVSRGGGIALLERPELERRLDELFAKRLGLVVADDDAGFALEVGVAVGVDGTGEDDERTISGHAGDLL